MFLSQVHIQCSSLFGALVLTSTVFCTTEWFGDVRARMNPPKFPPFYDITYDEPECPFGLESVAIPEFVYFGEMISSKFVREHSQCLQFCLETLKCKAVNFFESMERKNPEVGFCELLVENQYDNPRLMRPFKRATYHEKIHCRTKTEEEKQPFIFDENEGKELIIGNENNGQKNSTTPKQHGKVKNGNEHEGEKTEERKTSADQQELKGLDDQRSQSTERQQKQRKVGNEDQGFTQTEEQTTKQANAQEKTEHSHNTTSINALILKRLAERIRELKERFRN